MHKKYTLEKNTLIWIKYTHIYQRYTYKKIHKNYLNTYTYIYKKYVKHIFLF